MAGKQPKRKDRSNAKAKGGITCPQGSMMIWGRHATAAVLGNPARRITALYLTREAEDWLAELEPQTALPRPRIMSRGEIDAAIPGGGDKSVHQGIVVVASELDAPSLEAFTDELPERATVILLDQITDARNIGAIMRSARAFGAAAIIATERNSPAESPTLLKAASGAAEHIPLIRVVNLARAIEHLQDHGFTIAGMTAQGTAPMTALQGHERLGIIMGAEGAGLRRLTAERADCLVRIPIDDDSESLNVSVATAVALFAARR